VADGHRDRVDDEEALEAAHRAHAPRGGRASRRAHAPRGGRARHDVQGDGALHARGADARELRSHHDGRGT